MNNKTTKVRKNWCYIIFILGIVIMLIGVSKFEAKAKTEHPTIQSEQKKDNTSQLEKLTVWNIIEMNDWFLWPFIALTAVGIMLNVHRILVEQRDKSRSQPLLQTKIHANGIRSLVQMVRTNRHNRAARLFYQVISTFDKTNQAQFVNEEINLFITGEKESFERFNRVNAFLSESAGALGLLGTVWGIFITFYTAKFDGPTILRGMSIALITTLTGLIISLVLNLCGTYLYTFFNRQLNLLANKTEELRQALLYLEKKSNGNGQPLRENLSNYRVSEPGLQPKKQIRAKQPIEIAY